MVKARARSVKPKVQQGDFKKKKVKVGKKVQRANLTEIKVKSRRINIPIQNQVSFEEDEGGRDAINQITRQLHHYSDSTRLSALNKVKDILMSGTTMESLVALILPDIVEILFDQESETRATVVAVLDMMFNKYNSNSFLSVISVVITYICSGLTNLHKGVRKDSLIVLKLLSERCPSLLGPYLEKIMKHVLSLLTESFQSVSAPLLQQRDGVITTGMTTVNKTSSVNKTQKKKGEKTATDYSNISSAEVGGGIKNKVAKPTMFILILEVLASLLTNSAGLVKENMQPNSRVNTIVAAKFNPYYSASNAIVLLTGIHSSSSSHSQHNLADNNSSTREGKGNTVAVSSISSSALHVSLLKEILCHVSTVWQNLVMNSNSISIDVLSSLRAVSRIILCIMHSIGSSSCSGFDETGGDIQRGDDSLETSSSMYIQSGRVLKTLFSHFPHSCTESSIATHGSLLQQKGSNQIEQLDIILCEIAFVYMAISSSSPSATTSTVSSSCDGDEEFAESSQPTMKIGSNNSNCNDICELASVYLLQRLQAYIDTVVSLHDADNSSCSSKSNQDSIRTANQQQQNRPSSSTEEEKVMTKKIFQSFQLMMSRNTTNALLELLQLMEKLLREVAKVPIRKKRSIGYLVQPAVECLCGIIQRLHSELNDNYSETVFVLLIESTVLATEYVLSATWDQSAVLSQLVHAMLLLIQGKACSEQFVTKNLRRSIAKLCAVHAQFFVIVNPGSTSGAIESAYMHPQSSGFSRCSMESSKLQLLDFYFYAPYEDLYEHSESILAYLATGGSTPIGSRRPNQSKDEENYAGQQQRQQEEEQWSYFLRILFERRQDMGLADFIELLFFGLQSHIMTLQSISVVATNTAEIAGQLHYHQHVVQSIADVLTWIASSESPDKIVSFLFNRLDAWVLDATNCAITSIEDANNDSNSSSSEISKDNINKDCWIKQLGSAAGNAFGTDKLFYVKSSLLIITKSLLIPWTTSVSKANIRNNNSYSSSSNSNQLSSSELRAIKLLTGWIANLCSSFLLPASLPNPTSNGSSHNTCTEDGLTAINDQQTQYDMAVTDLIASMICIPIVASETAQQLHIITTTTTNNASPYIVFSCVLHELLLQLQKQKHACTVAALRVTLLRRLHEVMRSSCFHESVFLHCRTEIAHWLELLCTYNNKPSENTTAIMTDTAPLNKKRKQQQITVLDLKETEKIDKLVMQDVELAKSLAKDILTCF